MIKMSDIKIQKIITIKEYIYSIFQMSYYSKAVKESKGKVIAIIHRTNDDDDKLIVSKEGKDYSDDAIRALTEFQEKYFESIIIR